MSKLLGACRHACSPAAIPDRAAVVGKSFGDIAFGPQDSFLVSERLRDGFLHHKLTGIPTFEPVEIVKAKFRGGRPQGSIPQYFLINPSRGKADLDDRASGAVYDGPIICPTCRSASPNRLDRVVIKQDTWSGEDIFYMHAVAGMIIVSERFKRICTDRQLKNCLLVDADRYTRDLHPWERDSSAASD